MHRAAVEYLHPNRVVFHHVPKCGGTSVGRALRSRYLLSQATVLPEASFRAYEAFAAPVDHEQALVDVLDLREQMFLYLLQQDIRCVSAHVRFSRIAHELYRDRYRFITILREPVSRFVSHYHYNLRNPEGHAHLDMSFEDFLESPRARRLGAMYVEYFSGLPKEADIRSDHAIEAAIRSLALFDVVGRLDRLDEFTRDLKSRIGVRLSIGHENKAKVEGPARLVEENPQIREKVMALCAPDIAVWKAFDT